ncbi:MAG: hypothetical protein ACTSYS_05615 [Promethearchaeota archaeon]
MPEIGVFHKENDGCFPMVPSFITNIKNKGKQVNIIKDSRNGRERYKSKIN